MTAHITSETGVPVVVIGGGPAGATAATLLAQQGHRVQLFERDRFPRFHIGESLIPETYWVLKRLNMLDKMRNSPFVKKHSVQFVGSSGRLSEPFYFFDHKPHECSQTWQVLRSEFDRMMLDNAREHGVEVHEGVRVLDVLFEGERAVGVRIREDDPDGAKSNGAATGVGVRDAVQRGAALDSAQRGVLLQPDGEEQPNTSRLAARSPGQERTIRSRVIVDASGQSSMIMGRLNLREWDPELKKAALWTYWEGAYRDTGRDEGATLVLATEGKHGWFWYIPLHENIISVGIVASFEYLFKNRADKDHETIYFEVVDKCKAVKQRISGAKRVAGFRAAKEYSYRSKRAAGDGWVLVGDAFGFLDPLYSSGVLLALKSGQLAADAVAEGLAKGNTSAAQLGKWEAEFKQGMDRMRRLVCEYYDGFSFGRFVKQHPHFKGDLTDLLIGDLFKDELDKVFQTMDADPAKSDTEN